MCSCATLIPRGHFTDVVGPGCGRAPIASVVSFYLILSKILRYSLPTEVCPLSRVDRIPVDL